MEDETLLLELEDDAEDIEADAWASEGEPDTEAEGMAAEEQALPPMSSKDVVEASQKTRDMPPAQRPPPARRK